MSAPRRYEQIADLLAQRMAQGIYPVGDRLPSIRTLCREQGISITTAQAAYARLEASGLAEARPRSGYYVLPQRRLDQLPTVSRPAQRPLEVSQWDQVLTIVEPVPGFQPLHRLGSGTPALDAATLRPLVQLLSGRYHAADARHLGYDSLAGDPALRLQVARLATASGCLLHPDDVLVTTGCQEALAIALGVLTSPGDVVAVDSPGFYGAMQILAAHGLKALEIPTDPRLGMSLEALELALDQWPVRAILVTPTCNNPLGYTMPDDRKRDLVALASRHDVAIIEDDIYGDLAFDNPRPLALKACDTEERVLLCSSFSKTLAPGLRVGWIAPGRYRDQALHEKYVSTGASATPPQRAVAAFIDKGRYQRHLREICRRYRRQRDIMIEWVARHFPAATRISHPQGGFQLWLEMPEGFDSLRLNERLASERLQVAPGPMFSASGKYRHCLRLSYAASPTAELEAAVRRIGEVAGELLDAEG
ncbi:aminotransferase-like domain-containing protein [Halomonas organivorans]|uniref:DNA-binding transcriptional MocR family regulator n=1 Tax=Halomonas organivorans TaxID=257772 RepID=A0A7W5G6G7_9GAMM|nr:PLP-dependent aminotransferase family protein [Halomonas organivorans]MBB3141471.1 DNA-binding transcriptional MocR family regulator [Halomonas organivorans]